jgi:hypothetical protein
VLAGVVLASILCMPLMSESPTEASRSSRSVDPHDFVSRVDNRYFPLRPGTTLRYEGVAENGKTAQTDVVFVTRKRKRIQGVSCVVVRDTVSSNGTPVERTFD